MKFSHILGIIVIAIGIGIIVSTAGNTSKYVSFSEAYALANEGDDSKVHVIGTLKKSNANEVVGVNYEPSVDPNYLSFVLVDENQQEQEVVCFNPPASMRDFERSEKVVIIGRVKEGKFVANEILMKCPSKYEETEIKA